MKLFKQLLILTLVIGLAGACTKLEESPEPGDSTGGTGGGGGATGDPDVYLGVWKQTKKTVNGVDAFDANNTFTIKLDAGGTAKWTKTVNGVVLADEADAYILTKVPPPVRIDFINNGSKEIVTKTGSLMVWKWSDATQGGAVVEETMAKQ